MAEGSIVFHVPRPPAEVWTIVADLEQAPDWVTDIISVTKETDGPVGVGTRYSERVNVNGTEGAATMEVTRYDPPRVFANRGEGGPAKFTTMFTLEPDGDGTKVTHSYTMKMSGFMKMMEPMMKGWMRKNSEASVKKLQELFASGAGQ